jgi:hypothetical protein
MVHERFLKQNNSNRSWRIVTDSRNNSFDDIISKARRNWQNAHKKGNVRLAREIASKFNKNYNTWLIKAKKEVNSKRRHNSNFLSSLMIAKRSGNASKVNDVIRRFSKPFKMNEVINIPVSRHASPSRSGKPRWTMNLRKAMAARNYNKLKKEANALNAEAERLANKSRNIKRQLLGFK